MRVFITGATGFVGSNVALELIKDGYEVTGLTRSKEGALFLNKIGAKAHFGTLEDTNSITDGLKDAGAVIHTAFDHNFTNFVENCEKDKKIIEALGNSLKESNKPLIVTSGVGIGSVNPNDVALEDVFNAKSLNPRVASEIASNNVLNLGVDVRVVRLPQVHNTEKQGLISPLIEFYKQKGVVADVKSNNKWSAVNVKDVATLYKLVLQKGIKGNRYNAVAEEGVLASDVLSAISQKFNLPTVNLPAEQMQEYFGWLAMFVGANLQASSLKTCKELGWNPTHSTLIEDIKNIKI